MRTSTMLTLAGFCLGCCLVTTPALASTALQVTFQVDAGTPVTIVDGNDGVDDLNLNDAMIDFAATIDGVVTVDGRVEEDEFFSIRHFLGLLSRTPGGAAAVHNTDAVAHSVTVTMDSATFPGPGPALGWGVVYSASADDAGGGVVDVEPSNDVRALIDPGTGLVPLLAGCVGGSNAGASCTDASECPGGGCGSIHAPIGSTPAVDQPVTFYDAERGVDPTGNAVRARLVWTVDLGPDDEIRFSDLEGILSVSVFNAEDFCVVRLNKSATTLVNASENDDRRCVNHQTDGGDATACVDALPTVGSTFTHESQVINTVASQCTVPPAFGANLDTCCRGGTNSGAVCAVDSDCSGGACTAGACVVSAAEQAVNAITHDLFGPTVDVTVEARHCQGFVLKAAAAIHVARWKTLVNCKKQNISGFTTESDFVGTCLATPQPDPKGAIAKYDAKLTATASKKCIEQGLGPMSTLFPGVCAGEADADYHTCISRQVACRFCRGATVADDIQSPLDCDLFDDGVANATCS